MSATAINTFEAHRSELIGLAYRITSSRAEAEDIVQETFLKWLHSDYETIHSARAWLMKVATRLSLDHLKSAKIKRVSYIGPWLPEPFINTNNMLQEASAHVTHDRTPDKELELDESISMALLVLLEQLSPAERASFILHDLFHFDFGEIGGILEKTEGSCRKLASRARSKIGRNPISGKQSKDEHLRILSTFFDAVKNGDMAGLIALLKENVVLHPDGGGKAVALREVLQGANAVAAFLIDKVRPDLVSARPNPATIKMTWFNGAPGLIVWRSGKPITAFNLEIQSGAIKTVHALRNPEKLHLFHTLTTG